MLQEKATKPRSLADRGLFLFGAIDDIDCPTLARKHDDQEACACCAGVGHAGDIGRCPDGADATSPHAAKAADANVPGRRGQN